MSLLTPDHIVVFIQINHPHFGTIRISTVQRTRQSIADDVIRKKFLYHNIDYDAEFSDIINLSKYSEIYITIPWNYGV